MKNKILELYMGDTNPEENSKRKIPLLNLLDSEKSRIKVILVEILLCEHDNSIKGLIAESIKNIAEVDYPERYV